MVRPVQFYLSVRALVKDLDNALFWNVYNHNKFGFLKTGIQNQDLTSGLVQATPPCKCFLWADIIISSLNTELDV